MSDGARPATSALEREQRRREQAPSALGELCGACLERIDRAGAAGSTWSAGRAWHAVNGDIERAHTTGLYVREPRGHETLPTLLVYVDSRARATDFSANREVYLARLANVGLRFADVAFRVSKRPRGERGAAGGAAAGPAAARTPPRPLPELTAAERARVDELTSALPAALRDAARRAMSATIRAEKAEGDHNS
ncbi:hypothetical protein [Thermophilibacter sp.]